MAAEWTNPTRHARGPITTRRKYSWKIENINIGEHGRSKSRTSSFKNDDTLQYDVQLYDTQLLCQTKFIVNKFLSIYR